MLSWHRNHRNHIDIAFLLAWSALLIYEIVIGDALMSAMIGFLVGVSLDSLVDRWLESGRKKHDATSARTLDN